MSLFKKRLVSMALAAVFCLSAAISPNFSSASAANVGSSYVEPNVRVGLYVQTSSFNTMRFSSLNASQNGFEFGFATDSKKSFSKLFSLSNKSVVILPQVNAGIELSSAEKTCTPGNGSIGAYSVIMGKHSSFESASASAKSLGGFVAVVKGGYEVRTNPSQSYEAARAKAAGRQVASPVSGGITVVNPENGKILFTFEDTSRPFALRDKNGASVKLPITRNSKTNNYGYFGFFTYSVENGKLSMVNSVPLETYVKCVITNEIGYSSQEETVKVFAILIRTFAQGRRHTGYDVCQTTCCQAYYGTHRMDDRNNRLVDATRGLICTYSGKPVRTVYHAAGANETCSSVAAWGGRVSYLSSVKIEEKNPYKWQKEYTKAEFAEYIHSRDGFRGLKGDDLTMKIIETDPQGSSYITLLSVTDGNGNTVNIKKSDRVRSVCGYESASFQISYAAEQKVLTAKGTVETAKVSGVLTAEGYEPIEGFAETDYRLPNGEALTAHKVVINGMGRGHGVGISKSGCETLAGQGYNYKYIISYFYKGTALEYIK